MIDFGVGSKETTVILVIYFPFQTSSNIAYRVSSKTVPTWFFALLTASTHTNCKGWDIFAKFRKFAT